MTDQKTKQLWVFSRGHLNFHVLGSPPQTGRMYNWHLETKKAGVCGTNYLLRQEDDDCGNHENSWSKKLFISKRQPFGSPRVCQPMFLFLCSSPFFLFTPGVGQNTALPVSPAARYSSPLVCPFLVLSGNFISLLVVFQHKVMRIVSNEQSVSYHSSETTLNDNNAKKKQKTKQKTNGKKVDQTLTC